jgi:DNA topoisomerase-2
MASTKKNSEPMNKEQKELAKKYRSKTQYEHICDRPDTYIGSIKLEDCEQYIYQDNNILNKSSSNTLENNKDNKKVKNSNKKKDDKTNEDNKSNKDDKTNEDDETNEDNENNNDDLITKDMIIPKKMKYIQGLYKIFDEIIVNAVDNKNRVDSKIENGEKNHKRMNELRVKIFKFSDEKQEEKYAISVLNNGTGIDIAKHPEEQLWIPQMIFGKLLTSSNYDDNEKKVTGGKNGFGAKLTNIYSTYFKVETVDHIRKMHYTQIYRNRMLDIEEPIIKENYKGKPYTCITFIPDYKKFGLKDLTDDFINLFKKRTYDMVFCSNGELDVYYNDELCCCSHSTKTDSKISKTKKSKQNSEDLKRKKQSSEYMKMYIPEEDTILAIDNPHPRWQIGACMSPNFMFQQIGFVNGIYTSRGGKHIDYVTKKITSGLANWIKTKKKQTIRENLIKDNLMVFVNSLIENPDFDGQTKDTLKTTPRNFGSSFEINDEFITLLTKTGIVERVLAQSSFQETQILKKTDGKKKRRILDIEKLDDARFAGTKKGSDCTLILTEGDSAKATAVSGVSVLQNGSDYYGMFPLRGKLLNTRDASDKQIADNKEICNIKRILGLQEGVDYKDTSSLRYGRIMIMTDQDVDGSHIKGLVINYIASKFPSLLKINGFITSLLTPIVKVWKKGSKKTSSKTKQFYTITHFNEWLEKNNNGYGYNIKYYKGLGTSTPQEAKDYFREFKLVTYNYDDETIINIDKAFNKERANDRKKWLGEYDNRVLDLGQMSVSFTDFINKDLIQFSMADNARSIPNLMDGLKTSLRKILYCAFKRNLTNEIKVAQLAGYVSENGAYHHGEASLNGAIVNMAQNYPGTNNINLLHPEGQFGTRLEGGKDNAAHRYIFTHITPITKKIYRDEDKPLLNYLDDDGQTVEPEYYLPIIPMILVNGSDGIGTGWSSKCPQFNPLDIIKSIKNKLSNKPLPTLTPWYRGFKGDIKKVEQKGKKELLQWKTKGCYKIINDTTVEVFELPIGTWTNNYKSFLDKCIMGVDEKKTTKRKSPKVTTPKKEKTQLLKDYINESSDIEVKFTLIFESDILSKLLGAYDKNGDNEFERKFNLTSTLTCTNTLTFFTPDGKLKNYRNIDDILTDFYEKRIYYYDERKKYMEKDLEKEATLIAVKAKFINEIISKKLKINNVPKAEIINQLETRNYPKMFKKNLYDISKLDTLTKEEKNDANYNYLTDMSIYNLTKEKVDELNKLEGELMDKLDKLRKTTISELWMNDLDELETSYKKFMKSYYNFYGLDEKLFNKKKNVKLDFNNL